jgi:hypothetical protein
MTNQITHWQIISPEPDKVAAFYQKLFAWNLTAANALGYREFKTGGAIDGGVWPAPPGKPGFVQLHVEVADIEATVARAEKLGAKVVVPKSVLPDGDAMAVLLDPTGIPFVVCRRNGK